MLKIFKKAKLERLSRGNNSEADALVKCDSQKDKALIGVILLEIQKKPSVPEAELMMIVTVKAPTWKTLILEYLREGTLLEYKAESRKLKYKAARYVKYEGGLYKRGFS